MLLGRPWQYDRKVLHDGHTNKISFNFQGHMIMLKPLSPKDVNEDKIQIKQKDKIKKIKKEKMKQVSIPHLTLQKQSC